MKLDNRDNLVRDPGTVWFRAVARFRSHSARTLRVPLATLVMAALVLRPRGPLGARMGKVVGVWEYYRGCDVLFE